MCDSTFSLHEEGAKKKFTKRNAERGVSPLARGEEGYSPSTPQAFEKSLTKTFTSLTKVVSLVYTLCLQPTVKL